MRDAKAQLMIINQSMIGMLMGILPNENNRRKVIRVTCGRLLLRPSGRHEGLPFNVVILRHIGGFLVYIDGSI